LRSTAARSDASSRAEPARWWQPSSAGDDRVLCTLCPRLCNIGEGQAGFCYSRQNQGGALVSVGYGTANAFIIDPIEKKPLNHFLPGTRVLSFGTAGCNLGCKFCQNWEISKARRDQITNLTCSADDVVRLAVRHDCPSIAFTYNDPVIWAEWMDAVAVRARAAGVRTVAVTAGYVSRSARDGVFANVDAANVDLKAFTDRFYRKLTLSALAPVLETLVWLRADTDVWLVLTTLLIEGHNDEDAEIGQLSRWVAQELGPEVPLHFTAFHPDHKMRGQSRTTAATLSRARGIALDAGLAHVYTGNVSDPHGQSTVCAGCGSVVIERDQHRIGEYRLVEGNRCGGCGARLAGQFVAEHPFLNGRSQGVGRYHEARCEYLPFDPSIFTA